MLNNIEVEEKVNEKKPLVSLKDAEGFFCLEKPFESEQRESGANGLIVSGESKESMPPNSNTGAKGTVGLTALIDWVSITVPVELDRVYSLLRLPGDEFVQMKRGLNGYLGHSKRGNITILYNGQVEGMGIHVFMTGEGCREYEFKQGNRWKELFTEVFSLGGHFTRLDAAIDDYTGYFKIEDVVEKIKQKHVKSIFKMASERADYKLDDSVGNNGMSVYFGSNSSRIKIRMYDKAKQMGVDYFWNRTEVEARDERATLLAQEVIKTDSLGRLVAGVLKRYVNFIEPCGDSNKSRWDISDWWNKYLGNVEKIKLTIKKVQKTMAEVTSWIERQVAPSLAMVKEKFGRSFTSYMQYLLFEGKDRWTPHHHAILQGSM